LHLVPLAIAATYTTYSYHPQQDVMWNKYFTTRYALLMSLPANSAAILFLSPM
jgi:hypothetical protein